AHEHGACGGRWQHRLRGDRRAGPRPRPGDTAHSPRGARPDAARLENRVGTEPVDFCREIESYLCQKNEGHLVRVTGPSFDLVSGWAAQGIPLKVAFQGIDRYFERYYRKGPRRRPIRIDFCDADVLDVFDEWRRAVGLSATEPEASPGGSLPAHLQRVVLRLT